MKYDDIITPLYEFLPKKKKSIFLTEHVSVGMCIDENSIFSFRLKKLCQSLSATLSTPFMDWGSQNSPILMEVECLQRNLIGGFQFSVFHNCILQLIFSHTLLHSHHHQQGNWSLILHRPKTPNNPRTSTMIWQWSSYKCISKLSLHKCSMENFKVQNHYRLEDCNSFDALKDFSTLMGV